MSKIRDLEDFGLYVGSSVALIFVIAGFVAAMCGDLEMGGLFPVGLCLWFALGLYVKWRYR